MYPSISPFLATLPFTRNPIISSSSRVRSRGKMGIVRRFQRSKFRASLLYIAVIVELIMLLLNPLIFRLSFQLVKSWCIRPFKFSSEPKKFFKHQSAQHLYENQSAHWYYHQITPDIFYQSIFVLFFEVFWIFFIIENLCFGLKTCEMLFKFWFSNALQ